MDSFNVFLCPPNAAANVAFQLRTSRRTPSVPSEVGGTRPALVPSRENVATPNSSPPIESVSPADAKSVRTCPPSYDLYTYGVIPKYFAGGGVHPTTSTTSSSRSRHSHEKRAPPEASGKTRAVWRNRSSSASDGFASPSAGASSDAAASRDSRTNARVPTSVVNTEVVVCRVDDAVSVVRGAAEEEDSSGTKEPPRASDVPVSSETFRAAPNEDDARGLLADDTGVPPSSSDSAAREAARVSRKMPRGSSVTGWRREGGQRWVVCFPETRVRPEGTRAATRLAPATHQHRAPVRARGVGVRAIAAVRLYVRVAEHPHRASLDVEPARVERGLKDLSRASARLRSPDRTPCVRGERARHAQGEEREADVANPACHLPDAPRPGDRARASVSGRGGEERETPFR